MPFLNFFKFIKAFRKYKKLDGKYVFYFNGKDQKSHEIHVKSFEISGILLGEKKRFFFGFSADDITNDTKSYFPMYGYGKVMEFYYYKKSGERVTIKI